MVRGAATEGEFLLSLPRMGVGVEVAPHSGGAYDQVAAIANGKGRSCCDNWGVRIVADKRQAAGYADRAVAGGSEAQTAMALLQIICRRSGINPNVLLREARDRMTDPGPAAQALKPRR